MGDNLFDKVLEYYRYLHQCPGVGFDIGETFEYVWTRLEELGCTPIKCGKAGIYTDIGNGNGKCVLLRADMDGLSIKEESGLSFASNNGNMHACGHDMHTSMLLGAASILKEMEKDINGTIRLMFQPAEEILEGAKDMIENGIFSEPKPYAGIMIHVMTAMEFGCGTVIVSSPGVSAPAADYFSVRVKGVGGHGAMPEKTVDPLNIAAHILLGLENINAREIDSGEKVVVTIGSISSPETYNVIPDEVVMRGTMRSFDENLRIFIKNRIEEISVNMAKSFNGIAEVSFDRGCPTLINNEKISCHIEKTMIELLGEDKVFTTEELLHNKRTGGTGSEDFAYISHQIPTVMMGLVAGERAKGYEYNLHHPKVRFDTEALYYGAKVYAKAGLGLL